VLIEATANGPALIAEARRRGNVKVVEIVPNGRSKADRLRDHTKTFRAGRVHLPGSTAWKDEFIAEFVEFPSAAFDDQVDATTQYLQWIKTNPPLVLPAPRAVCSGIGHSGFSLTTQRSLPQVPGMVVGANSMYPPKRFY
jgi:hypothetical protein